MKIIYKQNPLYTQIKLNKTEKRELWYKIKVEILEDRLFLAHFYLNEPKRLDLNKVKYQINPDYYIGNDNEITPIDKRVNELYHFYLHSFTSFHVGDCTCIAAACTKCIAENLINVNTLKGANKNIMRVIDNAFNLDNKISIEEALENIKNSLNFGEHERRAYDWLFNYKEKNLL